MKIGPLTQILEIYQKKNISKKDISDEKQSYDKISISDEAYKKYQEIKNKTEFEDSLKEVDMSKLMDEVTQIDRDKIEQLKKDIKNGNYKVNYENLAQKIIDDDSNI